jgi:hypothetical protein
LLLVQRAQHTKTTVERESVCVCLVVVLRRELLRMLMPRIPRPTVKAKETYRTIEAKETY